MMKSQLFLFSFLVFLYGGCAKDPSKDVPAAMPVPVQSTANKAKPKAGPAVPEAPAAKDPTEKASAADGSIPLSGEIAFVGSKVTGSHEAVFQTWSGSATVPGGNVEQASFGIEIDTESVLADPKDRSKWSPKLEKHLRNPDFFDVEKFPKASFVSTGIEKAKDGTANAYTVSGTLTIKGVSQQISFPARITYKNGKFQSTAQFSINRHDFGISYPGKPDDLIRDGVVLRINLKN